MTASLIALAGERAVLYDLGATITSQRLVGRSPRKPFLITTTIAQAEAEAAPVRDDGFLGHGPRARNKGVLLGLGLGARGWGVQRQRLKDILLQGR
jgi:hypothetical protein